MPAKTTVISSPRKPSSTSDGGDDKKRNLTSNEFHQMAGRAGRRGIDTIGFCYPISCNGEQRKFFESLISSPSNDLESNLNIDFSFIASYLSEFRDDEEIKYILSKSLYTHSSPEKLNDILESFNIKKEVLKNENFIDSNGKLTTKGLMLKHLNGYEQIPLINIISDKLLADLNPKQIAGVIGALSNIEYRTKDDFENKNKVQLNSNSVPEKTFEEIKAAINKYSKQVESLHKGQELKFEVKVLEHLNKWAELNEKSENSRKNWKELYSGELRTSIRDEGSLFKEISMASDLLKQVIEAAECGKLYSESKEDKKYYLDLMEKCRTALDLIQREPVNSDSI